MKDSSLDNAISRLKSQALPNAPANLEQNVWRQVRLGTESETGMVAALYRLLFVSGWLVPAFALSIVFSALASSVVIAQAESPQHKAAHALGFNLLTESLELRFDDVKRH